MKNCVLCLVVSAVLTGAVGCREEKTAKSGGMPPVVVKAVPARAGTYAAPLEFTARVKPLKSVDLVARVSGYLRERPFSEGGIVRQGELLYRIEPDQYQIDIRQAEAVLERARAQALNAEQNFKRTADLFAQKIASPQKYDDDNAAFLESRAAVLTAEAALAQARLNESYTRISAPFDGWIGLTRADVGEYLQAPSPALNQLQYIDEVRIEFQIGSGALTAAGKSAVQNGKAPLWKIELFTAGNLRYPHPGTLKYWANAIDPMTDTLAMQAVFPNPERQLMPGEFVILRLTPPEAVPAVLISQTVIRYNQTQAYVLALGRENRLEYRPVTVIGSDGEDFVIGSGLKPGETVALTGSPMARPGVKVVVTP